MYTLSGLLKWNQGYVFKYYIYFACLGVCLLVSKKFKNGRTDWAQFMCGSHMTPGKVYGQLKIIIFYENALIRIEKPDNMQNDQKWRTFRAAVKSFKLFTGKGAKFNLTIRT